MKTLFFVFAALISTHAFAGHDMPPVKVSPQFENMKALLGTWEGTTTMGGKTENMKVIYELTSGGTAIVEKMSPGTPHEMVTVYANRGNKVHGTHYCMLGNQPEFDMKKSDKNHFVFEMSGMKGITDKNEMHMHGVALTVDGNKLKQEWTNFMKGKKGETAIFEFTKSKQ